MIDAVIEAAAGNADAKAAMVEIPVVLDGVALAIAWIAANAPEFRTQRGARQLADDVREVVKGMLRTIAETPDQGASLRFAHPIDTAGGRA